ncbi:MAG: bifunctional pantoate--beta-alanine ligase/(d)CMP kinase [Drouetiella hepatica Uher 2000/2452]|uniref:Bifunctional pantoate ligase/cytidylate kinase n=1 Tax=Drouetiella hepatica Uher 2000/2452 TaxID=904376 RepID=A0A951UL37_9CYAN|nr:bifunctional pantoate--beta-alanine ligase/(d)CMP kinase [Drouetiella hepatica Uher 2000/2452]
MRLFTTIAGLRRYLNLHRFTQSIALSNLSRREPSRGDRLIGNLSRVGLVPTMGALHAGHLSLIQQARQENDLVVVSIFVNPLQFAPHEDFQHYPRTLETDQQLCQAAGVNVIFAPSTAELYGSGELTQVTPPTSLMATLCGAFRPDHFPGVATVVTKLIGIIQPDRLYLGQKDAQQLAILRRVVVDLNLPVEVVGCPIVREADGLALSSRNRYLSEEERSQATVLYRSLRRAKQALKDGKVLRGDLLGILQQELSTVPQVKPQYIDLVHPDTMAPLEQIEDLGLLAIAAYVGSTRLIDNMLLRNRQPILAIDGPAGAGKSTVVRQVAHILGLIYLDTGAMYRAVTWLTLYSGIAVTDEAAIAELANQCEIVLGTEELGTTPQVWINGHNVTQEIRSLEVTEQVSAIAAQPAVRQELMKRQQAYGRKGGVVMDGRDIGTQVFPDAELKIFLTASVAERARRRFQDLQGTDMTLAQLEQSIADRDHQDSTRRISPLRKAEDAIEIQSDALSIDEVVAKIVSLYREKLVAIGND